jgi:hypothetical protein
MVNMTETRYKFFFFVIIGSKVLGSNVGVSFVMQLTMVYLQVCYQAMTHRSDKGVALKQLLVVAWRRVSAFMSL